MKGFFNSLPPKQQEAALAYEGPENFGFPAPAAMPSEEDVARLLRDEHGCAPACDYPSCIGGECGHECDRDDRSVEAYSDAARAILALFAPILAEKELTHVTGERITRKDLNNAYREGSEKGRLAAHLIDGINSPLNACCYRDGCRALEARALAAEAALASAVVFNLNGVAVESRGDGKWAIKDSGCVLNAEGTWEYEPSPSNRTDEFIARTRFDRDDAFRRAAAIRSEE